MQRYIACFAFMLVFSASSLSDAQEELKFPKAEKEHQWEEELKRLMENSGMASRKNSLMGNALSHLGRRRKSSCISRDQQRSPAASATATAIKEVVEPMTQKGVS